MREAEPGVVRFPVGAEICGDPLQPVHPGCVSESVIEAVIAQPSEEANGIAGRDRPAFGVKVSKECLGVVVPRPAQVVGKFVECGAGLRSERRGVLPGGRDMPR